MDAVTTGGGIQTPARTGRRVAALDALRGLTLLSMIAYHSCSGVEFLFHID